MADRDFEFWAELTPEERFTAVFELMDQLRLLGGDHGPAPETKEPEPDSIASQVAEHSGGGGDQPKRRGWWTRFTS